jgi:hypothetical protein
VTISQREIQALIAEIDDVLTVTEAASTGAGAAAVTQRDLLEKIRWLLGDWGRTVEVTPLANPPLPPQDQTTADAIAQSVIAQMNIQRSQWLQPLQLELETLRQQRESLVQEIRHLETHQRQLTTDFLNALLNRCSDGLRQELAQALDRWQGQFVQALPGSGEAAAPMQQLEWLEQLRSLQGQSDQLFRSLDSTFQQVFSSLEQDLKGYQKSLLQGIENIHALGQYSEALFHQHHNPELTYSLPQPLQLDPAPTPAPGQPPLQLTHGATLSPFPGVDGPERNAIALLFEDCSDPALPSPAPNVQAIPLPTDPTPVRSPQEATPPDTDWEDWDEHLFNSDQFATSPTAATAPPVVLTVSEQELITPSATEPDADLLPAPLADAELFGGLHDPATEAPEASLWLPVDPEAIAATVETILFEDYAPVDTDPLHLEAPLAETAAIPTLEDTIASLNDLLAQVSDQIAHTPPDEDEPETGYHIAPGETLLETAEISTQNHKDIEEALSPETLQQLSDDLMRFETGHQPEATTATPTAAAVTVEPPSPALEPPSTPTEAMPAPEPPETVGAVDDPEPPPTSAANVVTPLPGAAEIPVTPEAPDEPEAAAPILDDLGIDAIASLTDLMIDETPELDPFVVRETPAPEASPASGANSEAEPEPSADPVSEAESVTGDPDPEAEPEPSSTPVNEAESVTDDPDPEAEATEPPTASTAPNAEPGTSPVVRLQPIARPAPPTQDALEPNRQPVTSLDDSTAELATIPQQDVLKSLEDIIWVEDLELDSGDDFVDPWKPANGQPASNSKTSSG